MKNQDFEELKKQLEEAQKKIEELTINWKRALADYQNLEKRTVSDKQTATVYVSKLLLIKFLEVLDLLKSAQKHLNDEGLELVIKKFLDILRLEGVEKIETKNSNFDPGLMECVEVVEGESDNCVAEELSEGYVFQEYLLRPARVKVYKKAEKENNN